MYIFDLYIFITQDLNGLSFYKHILIFTQSKINVLNFYYFRCYLIRLAWYGLVLCSAMLCTVLYVYFPFRSYLICRTHYLLSWHSRLDNGPPGLHSFSIWYNRLPGVLDSVLLMMTHVAYAHDSWWLDHQVMVSHMYIYWAGTPSNILFLPLLSRVPNGIPLAVPLTGSFISLYSHSISLLSTIRSSSLWL